MILLRAKNVDFDVTYIDLTDKPDWFLKISPHGKVPVLSVDGEPLFESNAIAEYLEDVVEPKCHPADTFKRARNRAWTDFVPDFSKGINIYYTKTREEMDEKVAGMSAFLQKLEDAIAKERDNEGPYFNGTEICLVDASYAPFLQRFLLQIYYNHHRRLYFLLSMSFLFSSFVLVFLRYCLWCPQFESVS